MSSGELKSGEIMLENLKNELTIRGFSQRTIDAYLYYNQDFLEFVKKTPDIVTTDDIRAYVASLIQNRNFKPRSTNLAISSLRFYYDEFLEKNLMKKIKALKPDKKEPDLLNPAEFEKLYKAAGRNIKHRILIGLFLGSGPRVTENLQLRFSDIMESEGLAIIRKGKGSKQRTVIISKRVLEDISAYKEIRKDDKNPYIFKSYGKSGYLSRQQAWRIVKECAEYAGISKRIYPHSLRASFATNLLEKGYDMGIVQELLGHESANTTKIYAKYSKERIKKVKSPL